MLHILLSGRARWITHLVGWSVLGLLFFSLISVLRDPGEALARTALTLAFLIALFYINAKVLVNRFFEPGRYGWLVLLLLVFWLGMAGLRTWAELRLFGTGLFQPANLPPAGGRRMFVVYTMSFFLLLLFSTLYQLLENRYMLELRHRELEARHHEAQLNYLKAQINPHFLFNTLNNIYAAATLQHPRAADMVLRLSDLLRYVTYDAQADRVPLTKEVAQIRAYIELFELKSEQPLTIRLEVNDTAPGRHIEPVLLLPLVENALKPGDLDSNPAAHLHIMLNSEVHRLHFRVENTFNPADRQKDAGGGVGLANIRRRLELHYPGQSEFHTATTDGVFIAEIDIRG